MKKLVTATALVLVASFAAAALALAAGSKELMLGAKLDPMLDHAKGAPHATGSFTGDLKGRTLTWRLTFSKLSGPATAAHIHAGKAGVSGPVLIPLCGPCKSGQHGTMKVSAMDVRDLSKSGATYVNVHTTKNPNGEIRGQISVH
jgi:CHRD domain